MRSLLLPLAVIGALAAPVAALALNPQPLPPGRHAGRHGGGHNYEPPDPCRKFLHRPVALARCHANLRHEAARPIRR